MSTYHQNTRSFGGDIDLEFWRKPEGVRVPDDELSFLLVPDAVESAACLELAWQVHDYQDQHQGTPEQVTKALMVTMGGLLPGVWL